MVVVAILKLWEEWAAADSALDDELVMLPNGSLLLKGEPLSLEAIKPVR